jgi:four helix bundle protein
MPPPKIKESAFSADVVEFIRLLQRFGVRCLVVGGEAVIFHGYPRLTGDIDLFYERTPANARRLFYGLTSQCNRAAVSIAANLAEGSSRRSRKDQAHFSEIAYGSLMELACLLILCNDIGILSADSERALRNSVEKVSLQLNALHRSQRAGAG